MIFTVLKAASLLHCGNVTLRLLNGILQTTVQRRFQLERHQDLQELDARSWSDLIK